MRTWALSVNAATSPPRSPVSLKSCNVAFPCGVFLVVVVVVIVLHDVASSREAHSTKSDVFVFIIMSVLVFKCDIFGRRQPSRNAELYHDIRVTAERLHVFCLKA